MGIVKLVREELYRCMAAGPQPAWDEPWAFAGSRAATPGPAIDGAPGADPLPASSRTGSTSGLGIDAYFRFSAFFVQYCSSRVVVRLCSICLLPWLADDAAHPPLLPGLQPSSL